MDEFVLVWPFKKSYWGSGHSVVSMQAAFERRYYTHICTSKLSKVSWTLATPFELPPPHSHPAFSLSRCLSTHCQQRLATELASMTCRGEEILDLLDSNVQVLHNRDKMDTWVVLEDLSLFCKVFSHLILVGWGNEPCVTVTRCVWKPPRLFSVRLFKDLFSMENSGSGNK